MIDGSWDAIVSIADQTGQHLGSGFVVHRDPRGTYIVTSAHIIGKIGSPAQAVIAADPSLVPSLVSSNVDYQIDLVVLCVAGLFDRPILRLSAIGLPQQIVSIVGYRRQPSGTTRLRSRRGFLGEHVRLASQQSYTHATTCELLVEIGDCLDESYCGAPIITLADQSVCAVATYRSSANPAGQALTIEALVLIWPDLPNGLLSLKASETTKSTAASYSDAEDLAQARERGQTQAQQEADSRSGPRGNPAHSGDIIAGDKILGDKVLRDKQVFQNHISTVGGSITINQSSVAGDVVSGAQTKNITQTPPERPE